VCHSKIPDKRERERRERERGRRERGGGEREGEERERERENENRFCLGVHLHTQATLTVAADLGRMRDQRKNWRAPT
jgi:hypothetical protein